MIRRGGDSLSRLRICTDEVWVRKTWDSRPFGRRWTIGSRGKEKGVLGVAGGMILGSVQGIETEPFGLYLGGFGHRKTDLAKDRNDLAPGIGERMGTTVQSRMRGQGRGRPFHRGIRGPPFPPRRTGHRQRAARLVSWLGESLAKGRFFLFGKFSIPLAACVRLPFGPSTDAWLVPNPIVSERIEGLPPLG